VATILTKLTTKQGYLPQGAKTSALLANLVFWDNEPTVVVHLRAHGITYSRLIDDITISADTVLGPQPLAELIHRLHAMVHQKGLRLKRRKQTIGRAGDRMMATKLVVNTKTSLPKEERSRIRAPYTNSNTPLKDSAARQSFSGITVAPWGDSRTYSSIIPRKQHNCAQHSNK
jgi:hypothetical protein